MHSFGCWSNITIVKWQRFSQPKRIVETDIHCGNENLNPFFVSLSNSLPLTFSLFVSRCQIIQFIIMLCIFFFTIILLCLLRTFVKCQMVRFIAVFSPSQKFIPNETATHHHIEHKKQPKNSTTICSDLVQLKQIEYCLLSKPGLFVGPILPYVSVNKFY